MQEAKYKRILLKLGGECLMGSDKFGVDFEVVKGIAQQIREIRDLNVEIAIVIGGGNIWRGAGAVENGLDRASADYMGMMATVINAMALQGALETENVYTRVLSAIEINQVVEPYIRRRAVRHLEKGRVIIFAAGTGNPFFTTDTAASLRAVEVGADVILKGTKVDGVYCSDPMKNKDAVKYESLNYQQVLRQELKVMDSTSISLCKDNNMPIVVFNLFERGNLLRVVCGEEIGTRVN